VWFPGDPKQVHAPAGKTRVALYALCEECQKNPDAPQIIEDQFVAAATAEARVN